MSALNKTIGKTIAGVKFWDHSPGLTTDHYDGGFIIEFTDGTEMEVESPYDDGVLVELRPPAPAPNSEEMR